MTIRQMVGAYQKLSREKSWGDLYEKKVEESYCSGVARGCTSRPC